MFRWFILLVAVFGTTAAIAQQTPVIDWGSAGKGEAIADTPLPKQETAAPLDGFDCETVTRFSSDFDRATGRIVTSAPGEDSNLPRQVRRCSRDGISLEVTPGE